MPNIKEDDIKKIAHLARLGIDQKAMPEYAKSLTEILDFVEQMDAVNTDNISTMAHPQDMTQPLREDIVTEVDNRELLMQNAPKSQDGLFLVPKVLE